jgi:hypothetical protein
MFFNVKKKRRIDVIVSIEKKGRPPLLLCRRPFFSSSLQKAFRCKKVLCAYNTHTQTHWCVLRDSLPLTDTPTDTNGIRIRIWIRIRIRIRTRLRSPRTRTRFQQNFNTITPQILIDWYDFQVLAFQSFRLGGLDTFRLVDCWFKSGKCVILIRMTETKPVSQHIEDCEPEDCIFPTGKCGSCGKFFQYYDAGG